jgi:hypothetical protein
METNRKILIKLEIWLSHLFPKEAASGTKSPLLEELSLYTVEAGMQRVREKGFHFPAPDVNGQQPYRDCLVSSL